MLQNMLLGTLEGHTHQFWANFDMLWFFGIFEFLVKTHEIHHFILRIRQTRRMVSLDAINSGVHPERFLRHLEIIFFPQMAKNARFLHTLPDLSADRNFLVFYTQVQIWRTFRHQIEEVLDFPESRHS